LDYDLPLVENACKICRNARGNHLHVAREMFLGLREQFTYLECAECGCVQLLEIPGDMSKYYPSTYYSFNEHGKLKTLLRHQWSAYAYGRKNPFGWILTRTFFPNLAIQVVRRSGVPKTSRVLDVGCGSGRALLDLSYLGFSNLTGVDPFIEADLVYPNGVRVFKRELSGMEGQFDLITFHYSYEHMDQPAKVLAETRRLLSPGGIVIVRIPVASSYAWRHYGVNWFNLDPPRHFYIHTFKSMDRLARQASLEVFDTVQESGAGQFWTSEEYKRDIPHSDPRTLSSSFFKRLLAWKEVRAWKQHAEELNRNREGDLVGFYLRHAPESC
jgi:SAM-dependent methyltransferase